WLLCRRRGGNTEKTGKMQSQREKAGNSAGWCTRSVQTEKAHCAARQYLALGFGRGAREAVPDHLRRAREEAVAVRVVGRPQDLVRADIFREHLDAALDRLEGDPAISLKQLAPPGLEAGIVQALVVEMPVHAVEPWRDPAAARFEETDPQFRVALDDPAPDHAHAGEHHLHSMRDDVLRAAARETVDPDRRHAAVAAFPTPA